MIEHSQKISIVPHKCHAKAKGGDTALSLASAKHVPEIVKEIVAYLVADVAK